MPRCQSPARDALETRELAAGAGLRAHARGRSTIVPERAETAIKTCWEPLRSDPGNQENTERHRADDSADRIGGIHPANQPARILSRRRHRRQGQRKARSPQTGGWQHGPQAAHEIELQIEPRTLRQPRIDWPIRQRRGELQGGPRNGRCEQHLAQPQRESWPAADPPEPGAKTAAQSQTHQKHGENDRERVNRPSEHQRQEPRPDYFRSQSAESREGDRQIHCPCARRGGRADRRMFWLGRRRMRRPGSQNHGANRHAEIDAGGNIRGDCQIVNTQEIKAREQASEHGAGNVPAIEEPKPRDPRTSRFDRPRNCGQGGPHQQGRRQQADGGDQTAQELSCQATSNVR